MRLLSIEDERELADALSVALGKHGIVTDHMMHLADAVELTRRNVYDAILLDRRSPDGQGLAFIAPLRRTGTARNDPLERVEGLDLGAGDSKGRCSAF